MYVFVEYVSYIYIIICIYIYIYICPISCNFFSKPQNSCNVFQVFSCCCCCCCGVLLVPLSALLLPTNAILLSGVDLLA